MQRRYNSVEKFTEMHLATETIVDTRILRGRSHENLLPSQYHDYQPPQQQQHYRSYPSSPATTIVPAATTTPLGYDRNNNNTKDYDYGNNNNNSRPPSRTTFVLPQAPLSQQQQPQPPLKLPYLSPYQPQQQPMRNPQPSGAEVPQYYGSGAYGPNPSDPRYGAPIQAQQAWRPQPSADQQQQPVSAQATYQPLQYSPADEQQRSQYYKPASQQQQQFLPTQPQQQQHHQFQGTPYGVESSRAMPNGPVSTTSTPTIRNQQRLGGQMAPIGPGHLAYIPRTPSRSAHSKSHENLAEGGSSSGETLKFAEHLDAFFENNVPGLVWIIFAALQIIFGLVSIFVAVFNFNLCYVQPKIPVYLLVSGLILIINGSVRLCLRIPTSAPPSTRIVVHNGRRYKQPIVGKPKSTFAPGGALRYALEGCILFAILVIVILGCVWVYGARYVQFERYRFERNYCEYTLYWVSWWSVTGHLVVFSVFITAIITILLFGAIMSK